MVHDAYRRATINSRAKNLAVMQPFFSLEAFKGQRAKHDVDLEPHDLRRLAMVVLDEVIVGMGGALRGSNYLQILQATGPLIRAAGDAVTERGADIITTLVVEHLCNEQMRTVFVIPYQHERSNGTMEWRENRFKLLEPREGRTADTIYEATPQAINFFLACLDTDLEGAQAAKDGAISHYLKRGRYEEAAIAAEESRKLTIQFRSKIRRSLAALERNIYEVDYVADVMPTLDAARGHLNDRLRIDEEHIRDVEARLEVAAGEAGVHLGNMRDIFRNAKAHHVGLFSEVMDAHKQFRSEQTRQKFRPQSPQAVYDPSVDVMFPALKLPGGWVEEWIRGHPHLFLPLRLPKPPDFADLVFDHLLQQPPQVPVAEPPEIEEGVPQEPHVRFQPAQVEAAVRLLESMPGSCTLSELFERGRAQGLDVDVLLHAALKCQQWYGEDDGWRVWPTGAALNDADMHGDDLQLERRA